jgi:hypothetical protein
MVDTRAPIRKPRRAHAALRGSRRRQPSSADGALLARPGAVCEVRSTADDASVLVLLVLTLNSAAMIIRVASCPPSWMKD